MVNNRKPYERLPESYLAESEKKIDCLVRLLGSWPPRKAHDFLKRIAYRAPRDSKEREHDRELANQLRERANAERRRRK